MWLGDEWSIPCYIGYPTVGGSPRTCILVPQEDRLLLLIYALHRQHHMYYASHQKEIIYVIMKLCFAHAVTGTNKSPHLAHFCYTSIFVINAINQ